ncbi:MAG: PIN domain nuclease [Acidimicrobiia bacterium]|nr:PIN domain nuclease [Acidimicrobiia bacterium]
MGAPGPWPRLMPGVTLDTAALIAIERADRRMQALLDEAHTAGLPIDIPAGALAQTWRSGPRQARLARTLRLPNVTVPALDEPTAKAAGVLCGQRDVEDPIDASVVLNARWRHQAIVTGDGADLRRLDPRVRIIEV